MLVQVFKKIAFASVLAILVVGIQASSVGQDGGGDGGGGDGGQGGGGQGGGGANQGGGGGNAVRTGDGQIDLGTEPAIIVSEDTRNQGFVGATADRMMQQGFIGASSDLSGPPLAEEGTFGGGINDAISAQAIGNGGGGGGGGGGAGQQNGFSITRRSIRARMRPTFFSPLPSAQQIVSRFGDHLRRQPGGQSFSGRYSVSINNQTAVLTGVVNTARDADRLVRQLRLEPGVYRIVNRLEVSN